MKWFKRFGPGLLVTAAFIGPGTITTASMAGSRFGFRLLWVLLFAVLATIVLQEMSARLGLVSRKGLGEAIRQSFPQPFVRAIMVSLVVVAVGLGNAAFEAGNITGAAMGFELITGVPRTYGAAGLGIAALLLLGLGRYKIIERLLVVLVGVMSAVFVATAVFVRPPVGEVAAGLFVPSMPAGSALMTIALIGTTVVPYNLFLHASCVQEKWSAAVALPDALRAARIDTIVSVTLGGIITLAIVVTAATFFAGGTTIASAAQMADQLEPLLGPAARYFFAGGMLAAGLTSAITAPLAAAYATAGVCGWKADLTAWRFRLVWLIILLAGTVPAMLGRRPVAAIVFAQAANGMLLPVAALFLLFVVNRKALLREHTNGAVANVLGAGVVLIAAGLGAFQLLKVAGAFGS